VDSLRQDIRYAVRVLARRPLFTLAVAATLALGIGANSAIFSFVNAVLLRPLPYPEPERLMAVWTMLPEFGKETSSYPDFGDWSARSRSFSSLSAFARSSDNLSGADGEPERLSSAIATPNLFATLGVTPVIGRLLVAGDSAWGSHRVVVLSYRLWQRRYGGSSDILGQSIQLNATPYTVVGVAPPDMVIAPEADLWRPLAFDPANSLPGRRSDFLRVVGRLAPGATEDAAQAELATIAAQLAAEYPQSNNRITVDVVSLGDEIVGPVRPAMLVVAGAVGLVLLIACVNVANLLLARASSREQEMALRGSLGAGRGRLVRQLLTESVLLALLGGAAGLVLAAWGVSGLRALAPADLPRLAEVGLDAQVLLFTATVTLATGVAFGVLPALRLSGARLRETAGALGRTGSHSRSSDRLRSGLALAQIALALVLLVGAGLLMRSFQQLRNEPLGFTPTNVLTARVVLPAARYQTAASQQAFFNAVRDRVAALPGVEQVGLSTDIPLGDGFNYLTFTKIGAPAPGPDEVAPDAIPTAADTGFFRSLGIRLIEGRMFGAQDVMGAPRVAVVNEEMVRARYAGKSPVGERISFGDPADPTSVLTIVGVVASTRITGLGSQFYPQAFVPIAQSPQRALYFTVKSRTNAAALLPPLRAAVRALDPSQPVASALTMDERVSASIAQPRASTVVVGAFAAVAALLAVIGIYAVLAYMIAQRTREIGIRVALGATSGDVLRLIVGHGLRIVALGLVAGAVVSIAFSRVLAGLLFGVSPTDPLTFVSMALGLGLVATLATWLPARRALRVSPMESLRAD
jgi:predicted permease